MANIVYGVFCLDLLLNQGGSGAGLELVPTLEPVLCIWKTCSRAAPTLCWARIQIYLCQVVGGRFIVTMDQLELLMTAIFKKLR